MEEILHLERRRHHFWCSCDGGREVGDALPKNKNFSVEIEFVWLIT